MKGSMYPTPKITSPVKTAISTEAKMLPSMENMLQPGPVISHVKDRPLIDEATVDRADWRENEYLDEDERWTIRVWLAIVGLDQWKEDVRGYGQGDGECYADEPLELLQR